MKKYIVIILLFFISISYGQRKYAADRYFKEFSYVKSAELYEAIYNRGDDSKLVLSRLADSYYLNSKTKEAAFWYEKLFSLYEKDNLDSEYYFKYSQSLKINGDYEESDKWLLKFKEFNDTDSRLYALTGKRNYFEDFTKEGNTYVNIHNLSTNTKYSDYGGFISNDKVFFSSTRPEGDLSKNKIYQWNKQPFLNIYEADEYISESENMINHIDFINVQKNKDINSQYHEASAVITQDGTKMYFTRDNFDGKKLRSDKKRVSHLKIFSAELVNGSWTNMVELPFNNLNYSVGHPALSLDEKVLYFVSDMPNGYGATDLYKVSILGNNKFGEVVNLGEDINTEGHEMFPFVDSDNKLYFSSNGHIGLGALDVFESQITETGYESPVNLGVPINSNKDDFSFSIDKEKTRGYFSSNREGGKGDDDIYSFVINNNKVIVCEEFIEGVVFNKDTKETIAGVNVNLIDITGKIIERRVSDASGNFSFGKKDCGLNFTVLGGKTEFQSDIVKINTKDIHELKLKVDLNLTPIVFETEIVINPIRFDYNKSNIREDAEYELEKVVTVLKENPEVIIKIESHTDARGSREYNRKLSDRRAKSTRDYILSRGIANHRIESAIGYGEDRLLNECDDFYNKSCTDEEHQKNRRSYFFIVKGKYVKAENK
ncbi:OmpA family protein [uncultured Polaribacter sp.]|uniref:OmpA family protein n=1 Tax=uncultured Polaribacter sp. TaxID=174711 RepID=UPI002624CBCD|nr:OmpA family protein [uncultured Polaribacter sp.]